MEASLSLKQPHMRFEVEKVIGVSGDGNYQVQWAPAWVSRMHLIGCEHLIEEFLQHQATKITSNQQHQQQLEQQQQQQQPQQQQKQHEQQQQQQQQQLQQQQQQNKQGIGNHLNNEVSNVSDVSGHFFQEVNLSTNAAKIDGCDFVEQLGEVTTPPTIDVECVDVSATAPTQCTSFDKDIVQAELEGVSGLESGETVRRSLEIETLKTESDSGDSQAVEMQQNSEVSSTNIKVESSLFDDLTEISNCSSPSSLHAFMINNDVNHPWNTTNNTNCQPNKSSENGKNRDKNHENCGTNCANNNNNDNNNNNSNTVWSTIEHRFNNDLEELGVLHGEANDTGRYTCRLCNFVTTNANVAGEHHHLHENRPHQCNVCGKLFTRKHDLKRHFSIHTGVKPFKCPGCKRSIRMKGNLKKHMQTCRLVRK